MFFPSGFTMSFPCVIIIALLAADPRSRQSADYSFLSEAALQRLQVMQPADQREWLLRLEKRLNRANHLNLKTEVAEQERLNTAALLRQKQLTAELLKKLIAQTDEREKIAIARLVRAYRSQVLETFPRQQDKIFERQNAWDKVYESWEKAEEPFDQQDQLLDWLEKAMHAVAPKNIGPIPPPPKFTPDPKVKPAKSNPKKTTLPEKKSEVEVNRDELSTRIAGLNLNLRALETELDEQKNEDVDQLTAKMAKLKTLAQQRKDLMAVRDLLGEEDRKYIVKPQPPRAVIAQMGQHIAELRTKLSDGKPADRTATHSADLDKLDQLSKDLAALAAE
jgi:hypothetical protein